MLVKKDVLHLVQHRILRGGGEEFQPDKYLTDNNSCYPSRKDNILDFIIL